MLSSKIHTKVINVELTDDRKDQIVQKFSPVTRIADGGATVSCDVVIRKIHRVWSGDMYCVLVRLVTTKQTYYAVASAHQFLKSISKARDELQETLNKKTSSDVNKIKQMQQSVHKKYFVEMFIH